MIATDHLKAGSPDPVEWANDSLALAKQAWVQPQTNIDETYYLRERPVVDRQLALAGLRLARLLNEELDAAKSAKALHFYSARASATTCVFSGEKPRRHLCSPDAPDGKCLQKEPEHIEDFVADFHVA